LEVLDHIYQKARESRIPLSVHFDLTYRCPQRCIHCYLPEAWRRGSGPGPELETAQICRILDLLADAGTFFLTFSGGEVFLRADLIYLVEYARRLNFSVSLMTTGTIGPDAEQIRVLADLGIGGLLISLHSLEAHLHDRITGTPGSWERVQGTIQAAQAQDLQVILNSTIMRPNFAGARALKEYAAREDLFLRMDDEVSPRWDGRPHPEGLVLTLEEHRLLYQELGLSEISREPTTVPFEAPTGGCQAGATLGYITPEAELMPCMELRWPLGRLTGETDFLRLWQDSPTLVWLRSILNKDREVPEPFCAYLRKNRINPPQRIFSN
jgi:MoaA/NifB/PqqE/SkfB family radical SAM enzyme